MNSKRAFKKGVLLAFGVAFAPLAVISMGLFFSGMQPSDFNPDLRWDLLGVWLVYVFTADRIANLRVWLRIPLLHSAYTHEVVTVIAVSALLATMRLDPAMTRGALLSAWLNGFTLILLLVGLMYLVYKVTTRSRRIARARNAFMSAAGLPRPSETMRDSRLVHLIARLSHRLR